MSRSVARAQASSGPKSLFSNSRVSDWRLVLWRRAIRAFKPVLPMSVHRSISVWRTGRGNPLPWGAKVHATCRRSGWSLGNWELLHNSIECKHCPHPRHVQPPVSGAGRMLASVFLSNTCTSYIILFPLDPASIDASDAIALVRSSRFHTRGCSWAEPCVESGSCGPMFYNVSPTLFDSLCNPPNASFRLFDYSLDSAWVLGIRIFSAH